MIWAQTSNCPAIVLVRWSTNLKKNTSKLANRSGITISLNIKAMCKDEWRNPQHCEKLGKGDGSPMQAMPCPRDIVSRVVQVSPLEGSHWRWDYNHHLLKRCGFGIRSIHALPLHPASVMPLLFPWGLGPWKRNEGWRRGKPALTTLSFGTAVRAKMYLRMSRLC